MTHLRVLPHPDDVIDVEPDILLYTKERLEEYNRLERIKASMLKINRIMRELREMSDEPK